MTGVVRNDVESSYAFCLAGFAFEDDARLAQALAERVHQINHVALSARLHRRDALSCPFAVDQSISAASYWSYERRSLVSTTCLPLSTS
jgi:hypothetical protein